MKKYAGGSQGGDYQQYMKKYAGGSQGGDYQQYLKTYTGKKQGDYQQYMKKYAGGSQGGGGSAGSAATELQESEAAGSKTFLARSAADATSSPAPLAWLAFVGVASACFMFW